MSKDTKQEARLLKGLFKDSGELDQPESTWRYALNALMNEQKGSVSNEKGTRLGGYIKTVGSTADNRDEAHFYKCVGAIEIDFNRVILFIVDTRPKIEDLTDPTNNYYPRHFIGLYDDVKNVHSSFKILYKPITDPANTNGYLPFDLNFNVDYPIEGTYRIDSKEDVIVYWTDDLNPPRAFNVSRQLRQKDGFGTARPVFWLYNTDPATTHPKHIGLLDLFPSVGPVPTINAVFKNPGFSMIGQGGGLLTGVYYLALAYIDEDFVSTNYLTVSNPVSIVPGYEHTRPTTKMDGAVPGTQTSKSITWNVQNINTDYKYLKCAVIRKKADAVEAFQLSDKIIVGDMTDPNGTNNLQISFAGTEGFTPVAVEDVMIDTVSYDTAKTITQMDNVLYMGNLTGSPDLGYQKYANNIKVNAHKMPIDDFDRVILSLDNMYTGFANSPVDSVNNVPVDVNAKASYRDGIMNTYRRGYRRGEVYAFYIAFILNDGSMSYAYHIPGREPIKPQPIWPKLYSHSYGGNTSRGDYEYWGLPQGTGFSVIRKHHESLHAGVKSFHFYDCSEYTSGSDANARAVGGSRHMGYWHNLNELYPDDRAISEVWDRNTYENGVVLNGVVTGFYNTCANCNNGGPYTGSGMQGMQVRHHKMPSNSNAWARTIEPDEVGVSVPSQPVVITAGTFSGSFFTKTNVSNWWMNHSYSVTTSCKGTKIFAGPSAVSAVAPSLNTDPLPWSTASDRFTANTANTIVTLDIDLKVYQDNNGCSRTHHSRVRYKETATSSTQTAASNTKEVCSNCWRWNSYTAGPINLQIGGTIWLESAGDQGGTWLGGCPHKGGGCGSHERHVKYSHTDSGSGVKWTVQIGTGSADSYDVNLTHNVHRLGISLEDINIPKTYYDKIQGFRIYYAKRTFTNKTILGQAPVIPMTTGASRLGICSEAVGNAQAGPDVQDQVLSVATTGVEPWIAKEAWAYEPSGYTTVAQNLNFQNTWRRKDGGGTYEDITVGYYKYFSFYDFNMLDNHHSISGATHIQLVYVSNNWTWNGPSLYQPKKMLSEIKCSGGNPTPDPNTGLFKVQERWGWDGSQAGIGPQNCYNKEIKNAIFAGGKYITAQEYMGNQYVLTRLLSQKAKTYLNGDSILLAQPLGFSGKVINTFGDSTIALALKDKVELPALYSSMDGTLAQVAESGGGNTVFNVTNTAQAEWGIPPTVVSVLPTLANPALWQSNHSNMYDNIYGDETVVDATANISYITNLCAFKTDVYRSVDNQELVWTGFQVVGEDLNNFFFENEYLIPDLSNPASANYGKNMINPNFSQQWRPDVVPLPASGTGVSIVINNNGAGAGASATANISVAGLLTGVTLNSGGAGYTNGASAVLKLHGVIRYWITLTVTDNGSGVLTGITSVYTPNTFKIETGECMQDCTDPAFSFSQLMCESGQCTKVFDFGGAFAVLSSDEMVDDPDGHVGGTGASFAGQADCELHGHGTKFQFLGPTVNYVGLTQAEYNAQPGLSFGLGWQPYMWLGGGETWIEDCGGIYGGDTFITRQGIATGAAALEENRTSSPVHALHYHIVESDDNINFRHMENKDSVYYPESIVSNILTSIGTEVDPNTQDQIKYDRNFSSLNDVRTAVPLPIKDTDRNTFPTRTIRSTVNDSTGIIDNYRIWLANQFKDLPKNRGQLWKLSTFNNLIYFHMEQSLFKAAGKQTMQMGDGSDAYVGSGDIFKQEPTEIIQTKDGYGGTQSQYAALTTRFGYFFVDRKGKKVFMMKDTLLEISALGMENWFSDNMNYELINYGATELDAIDNPIVGLGYHSVWDPYNKRIILTKRDLLPTQTFIDGFNLGPGGGGGVQVGKIKWFGSSGCFKVFFNIKGGPYGGGSTGWACLDWDDETYFTKSGWTLSYYPDQAVWCSFHSYVPYIYFNTTETFYSINDSYHVWEGPGDPLYPLNSDFTLAMGTAVGNKGIWKHNYGPHGMLYKDNVMNSIGSQVWRDALSYATFEIEVIQNKLRAVDTLTSSIGFLIDVISQEDVRVLEHGFTSFYLYNTFQISGDETSSPLEYLVNTRRIGNHWKVNNFRDLSNEVLRGPAGPQGDPYYMSPNTNIIGQTNIGTMTTSHATSMFTKSGMTEIVNPGYLNLAKNNLNRRKFIDKWIGIRLIYDNITNNLLNLYSTSVEARKMYR